MPQTRRPGEHDMYDWFFNCRKFTERASRALDEPASPGHWLFMRIRRWMCRNSDTCWHQMHTLRHACRHFDDGGGFDETTDQHLSVEACARIKGALADESHRMRARESADDGCKEMPALATTVTNQ